MMWLLAVSAHLAGIYLLYRVGSIFYRLLYPFFIGTPVDLHAKAGAKWAVVTGATDGIGRAYAFELASKGFNILLVSRTQSKLDDTKKGIEAAHKVEVRTFAFNFCANTNAAYEPLVKTLQGMEVGILVNNVGMCPEPAAITHLASGDDLVNTIAVNTIPMTLLCKAVLPQMLARKSGIIVNVASVSAFFPMLDWSVYSSTKRFMVHFTNILNLEYAGSGVTIQALSPGVVVTKMSKAISASVMGPDPETYARSAVRSIGLSAETCGYWPHQIEVEIAGLLPSSLIAWLAQRAQQSMKKKE